MNAGAKRNGLKGAGDTAQPREGLAAVPHDKLRLGVLVGDLVQGFDAWHLAAALGLFPSAGEHPQEAVDPVNAGMHAQDQSAPDAGQMVRAQRGAVKEGAPAQIGAGLQPQGADTAGDPALQIGADAQGGEGAGQPAESTGAGTRRAELFDQGPPQAPKWHRPKYSLSMLYSKKKQCFFARKRTYF